MFLQEINYNTHHMPRLTDSVFTRTFHATNDHARSKGVSILISKDAPFELTEQLTDPDGRFVFLKGTYGGAHLTLANAYFPNKSYLTFCKHIVKQLQGFTSGCLILGGDFNIPLNPLADTSTSKTSIKYKVLKKMKSLLHSLQLIDSWCFLNPDGRDFTFYSIPHER